MGADHPAFTLAGLCEQTNPPALALHRLRLLTRLPRCSGCRRNDGICQRWLKTVPHRRRRAGRFIWSSWYVFLRYLTSTRTFINESYQATFSRRTRTTAQSWRWGAVSPCSVRQRVGVLRPSLGLRFPWVSSPQVAWPLGTFSRSTGNSITAFKDSPPLKWLVTCSSPLFICNISSV